MGRWDDVTLGRWDDGTMGRRDDGTMGRWDDGTMVRWDDGTMRRWDDVMLGRCDAGTMRRWDYETMGREEERYDGRTAQQGELAAGQYRLHSHHRTGHNTAAGGGRRGCPCHSDKPVAVPAPALSAPAAAPVAPGVLI